MTALRLTEMLELSNNGFEGAFRKTLQNSNTKTLQKKPKNINKVKEIHWGVGGWNSQKT